MAVLGDLRETPGSVAWHPSSSAADVACGIGQRLRRASTRTRARSKSASGAMHNSPRAAVESGAPSVPVFQSVQLAGMRERLAIWKYDKQQQSAASLYRAHNRQR